MDLTVSTRHLPPSILVSYLQMSHLLHLLPLFRGSILGAKWLCSITLSVCRFSRWQRETESVCVYNMSVHTCEAVRICLPLCVMWLFRQPTHSQLKQQTKTERFQMEALCKPQWPIPSTTTHTQSGKPALLGNTISHSPAMFISSDNLPGQAIVSLFIWTSGSRTSSSMIPFLCSLL